MANTTNTNTTKIFIVSLCGKNASDEQVGAASVGGPVEIGGLLGRLTGRKMMDRLANTLTRVSVHEVVDEGEYSEVASDYYDAADQDDTPWQQTAETLWASTAERSA